MSRERRRDRCDGHDEEQCELHDASVVATNSQYFTDELAASPAYDASVPERDSSDVDLLQELYSTGLLVALLVDAELARIGVPDRRFSFIGWVTRLEPVTPSVLAAETGLPPTTIRDYVRQLVASGDARKVRTPLTAARTTSSSPPRDAGSLSAAGPRSSPRSTVSNATSSVPPATIWQRCESSGRPCGWRSPRLRHGQRPRTALLRSRGRRGSRPRPRAGAPTRRPEPPSARRRTATSRRGRAPARGDGSPRRSRRVARLSTVAAAAPSTSRSRRAAASASSMPSGASRSRRSARLAMRPSRSPPPAVSTATSHSAAMDTAARSSGRPVTTEPSERTATQARMPSAPSIEHT